LKVPFVSHNVFHLDRCFNEEATNEAVYEQAARPLIQQAMDGNIATM
jgi:hypothetical protein